MECHVDYLIRTKGLNPTVTFREDLGCGIVYCATSNGFYKVTLEDVKTLRRLSKGQEDVWLPSRIYKEWRKAGWIGVDGSNCPFSDKQGRTKDQAFKPLHALIVATLKCNASCVFCSAYPYMKAYGQKEFISLKQAELLAKRLYDLGVMQCTVAGGEPTLSPFLEGLLDALVHYKVFPTVVSNGLCWPYERYIKSTKMGITWAFSYHSDNPLEHDKIMNKPGAHKTLSRILKELSIAGLKPHANVVVTTYNISRLDKIIEALFKLGVKDIILSQHLHLGRSDETSLHPSILGDLGKLIEPWKGKGANISRQYRFRFIYEKNSTFMQELFSDFKGGCPAGIFELLVFPDGTVYPCDYLWEDKFRVGNLFEDDAIRKITSSCILSMLQALEPDKVCLDCEHFDICRGCCPGVRYLIEGKLAYPNPECPLLRDRL